MVLYTARWGISAPSRSDARSASGGTVRQTGRRRHHEHASGDDFELHICESTDRVVVFMIVPGEDAREYGSRHARSRSWVVRVGDLDDVHPDAPRTMLDGDEPPVVSIQVSGPLDERSGA